MIVLRSIWNDVTQLDSHVVVRNLNSNEVALLLINTGIHLILVEVFHLDSRVEFRHVTSLVK